VAAHSTAWRKQELVKSHHFFSYFPWIRDHGYFLSYDIA